MSEGASKQSSDLKNYTAPRLRPPPPVLKFLDPPLIPSVQDCLPPCQVSTASPRQGVIRFITVWILLVVIIAQRIYRNTLPEKQRTYMQLDLCKIHKEVQKRQGNDHLTSPLHPLRFLVPYLEIDELVLNFNPYVKVMYEKMRKNSITREKLNFRKTCTKI